MEDGRDHCKKRKLTGDVAASTSHKIHKKEGTEI